MYPTPCPHPLQPINSPYPLRLTGPSGFFYAHTMAFLPIIIAFAIGIATGAIGVIIIALLRACDDYEK